MTLPSGEDRQKKIIQGSFWAISLVGLYLLFYLLFNLFTYPQSTFNLAEIFKDDKISGFYTAFFGFFFLSFFLIKWSGKEIELKSFNLRKFVYFFLGFSFVSIFITLLVTNCFFGKFNISFHSVFTLYMVFIIGGFLLCEGYSKKSSLFFLGLLAILSSLLLFSILTGWLRQLVKFDKNSLFLSINLFFLSIILGEIIWKEFQKQPIDILNKKTVS